MNSTLTEGAHNHPSTASSSSLTPYLERKRRQDADNSVRLKKKDAAMLPPKFGGVSGSQAAGGNVTGAEHAYRQQLQHIQDSQ